MVYFFLSIVSNEFFTFFLLDAREQASEPVQVLSVANVVVYFSLVKAKKNRTFGRGVGGGWDKAD